jgi:hypothetical protein
MAAVHERVQQALEAKEFQEIGPILDQAELEVGCSACKKLKQRDAFAQQLHGARPSSSHCAPRIVARTLPYCMRPRCVQAVDPQVLQDWPCALHMLGHIYNNNL